MLLVQQQNLEILTHADYLETLSALAEAYEFSNYEGSPSLPPHDKLTAARHDPRRFHFDC
jgi:hypothetical protein